MRRGRRRRRGSEEREGREGRRREEKEEQEERECRGGDRHGSIGINISVGVSADILLTSSLDFKA